jgi:hypothetical protein
VSDTKDVVWQSKNDDSSSLELNSRRVHSYPYNHRGPNRFFDRETVVGTSDCKGEDR